MTKRQKPGLTAINTFLLLSLLAVLTADFFTPLGIGMWVFYLVPVMVSLYAHHPAAPLVVGAISSVFMLSKLFLLQPLPGVPLLLSQVNRGMAVVAIWVIALVARHTILTRLRLRDQQWVQLGQRDLGQRLQGEQSLDELGDNILGFLCQFLQLPVGVLYLADGQGRFRRAASYALGEQAGGPELLVAGEGLLGQAVKDRQLMRFEDVPAGYLQLSSSLGRTTVRQVVAIPAQVDGDVNCAIELGFAQLASPADLALLQSVAEPIAMAVRSTRYRLRVEALLQQTQRQAIELQSQQEELKVANEELERQRDGLQESQALLESQQVELEQTNTQLELQTQELELQRDHLGRVQAELLERAEELERINQFKSEFLANMSHELRTPLNSALILAKLLTENKQGNLTAEQVKYADTIHSSGQDLLELINDILDLSRIEAGRMEVHPQEVQLTRLAEALERTVAPLAAQKHLRFEIVIEPGAAQQISTDPLRLEQILRNLLANAFKFTKQGEVRLDIAAAAGQRIAFAVRDTGVGIPAAQQEVIFEAFRQADGTTQREFGGTGLGLTISRQLARLLGGEIDVASEPGKGSTFRLLLPIQLEETPAIATRAAARHQPAALRAARTASLYSASGWQAAPATPLQKARPAPPAVEDDREQLLPGERTLLIIEDDLPFARILQDQACEQGFRALVATSGGEGLELAQRFIPSAIVLDLFLPDNSGLGVLEQLKRHPATRHIPVHVISVSDYMRQAFELGAIGYALKPVRSEQLIEAFKKIEQRLEQAVRRVLVVESLQAGEESIATHLSGCDKVEIVSVAAAADALERLEGSTFDCLVLDLDHADGLSGYELLEQMAASEAFSFPPVIAYSSHPLSPPQQQRLWHHASSIVIKDARSPERLLDEIMLFLHQLEAQLPEEQQQVLREVRCRESALEGRTVLVVEDDARNVFAMASVLEPRGAKLRIARNGREALALLEKAASEPGERVDLVLMDIMMPEMDGLSATRAIRKRPEWRKLPIIALTAKAMPDDRESCLQAGADDYLAKPLDLDKLVSLVKVWMSK